MPRLQDSLATPGVVSKDSSQKLFATGNMRRVHAPSWDVDGGAEGSVEEGVALRHRFHDVRGWFKLNPASALPFPYHQPSFCRQAPAPPPELSLPGCSRHERPTVTTNDPRPLQAMEVSYNVGTCLRRIERSPDENSAISADKSKPNSSTNGNRAGTTSQTHAAAGSTRESGANAQMCMPSTYKSITLGALVKGVEDTLVFTSRRVPIMGFLTSVEFSEHDVVPWFSYCVYVIEEINGVALSILCV
ncbi:Protein of unknown function [Pyronema omphalodes CBS 100304]|uniref:Uncharacterized protein n=1 Tax=Pyronema omphalodes (strain CBS 100304) TaxID=1076935 RepID=U4LBN1_PYROM|nr:Protein of unknown function [Pyronema omphalodes CBS 100304]